MSVITDKKAFTAATRIFATDAKRLPDFLAGLTPFARKWLEAGGFDAAPNSCMLVPGKTGAPDFVVAGVKDGSDPWALAALPLKLPRGRYELGQAAGTVKVAPDKAAFGWALGGYQFTRYKKPKRKPADLQCEYSQKVKAAIAEAEAVAMVRDMVNTPAEDMGPQDIADLAREQAELFGGTFTEIVGDELLAENFPAIHAVGRAAQRAPRLIEITWGNPKHPKIAIVGKGVCFDSGGLDIKTADGMRLMKKDMGGAAHALALARLVMQQKLPLRMQLLIPAIENAISGNAFRPGDIFRTRQGHTIEIGNTDAEGRVILCDALAYAVEQKPGLVIDYATLTGAARVALGPELPAMFTNRDVLAAKLETAANIAHDPLWRMPLWRNYRRLFDSDVADFNNSGRSGFAGAIVAALFLDFFVPENMPWIHFDTYAWNDISRPGRPAGGEAMGLRAVFELLKDYR
ncbi:MAG: leucyl aminopeptidase family protein [Betaproteobacteria bacterium]|nr:leucyl aminopeptidase family protein [Betaproteobacteria bacterium]